MIHVILNDFDTFTSFIPCCILKIRRDMELYKWMADSADHSFPNLPKPFGALNQSLRIHAGPFHAHAPMLSLFKSFKSPDLTRLHSRAQVQDPVVTGARLTRLEFLFNLSPQRGEIVVGGIIADSARDPLRIKRISLLQI